MWRSLCAKRLARNPANHGPRGLRASAVRTTIDRGISPKVISNMFPIPRFIGAISHQ
jgi:hypothetical protein